MFLCTCEIKKLYEAPTSETVEVKMNGILCDSQLGTDGTSGDRNVEGREDGGSWGNGDWY